MTEEGWGGASWDCSTAIDEDGTEEDVDSGNVVPSDAGSIGWPGVEDETEGSSFTTGTGLASLAFSSGSPVDKGKFADIDWDVIFSLLSDGGGTIVAPTRNNTYSRSGSDARYTYKYQIQEISSLEHFSCPRKYRTFFDNTYVSKKGCYPRNGI